MFRSGSWVRAASAVIAASIIASVAACGRLGYDEIAVEGDGPDAGPGSGRDTGGGAAIDGGGAPPPLGTDEIRLTSARGASLHPVAVWSGSDLYVVWDDNRRGNLDLYLARLPSDGAPREVRLTDDAAAAGYPTATWASGQLSVAWEDNRSGDSDIYARAFSRDGAPVGDEVQLTSDPSDAYDPSLAWSGGEHVIAFHQGDETRTEMRARRLGRDLRPGGNALTISRGAAHSQFASLIWTGREFSVAWQDTRDGAPAAYAATLATGGSIARSDARASSSASRVGFPVLTWSGREYGLAWADSRGGASAIYFARLDGDGARIGDEVKVSSGSGAASASLTWTGQHYALAWAQGGAIQLALLGSDGVVASVRRVSDSGSSAAEPSVVWMDGLIGVAWHDTRGGDAEIYVRAIAP
jgi:hypothetical protein